MSFASYFGAALIVVAIVLLACAALTSLRYRYAGVCVTKPCWSHVMTFGKVFRVHIVLSLAATGVAMARDISNGTVDVKGNTASLVKGDKGTGQVPVSVQTPHCDGA
jgi:hypothetical protein